MSTLTITELKQCEVFAKDLVLSVAERIRTLANSNLVRSSKGDDARNEVTTGDTDIETLLIARLCEQYPTYAIHSEESGGDIENEHVWVIDPIDGTSCFARRIPLYATSLTLLEHGEPVLSVVMTPSISFEDTADIYSFVHGEGVTRNGMPTRTSGLTNPKEAFALVRPGRNADIQPWAFRIIEAFTRGAVSKVANFGSSAHDLCLLATGSVDIVIYGTMTTLDIAGAIAMVRANGGEVYSKDGTPVTVSNESQPIVAVATPALYEALKPLLE